MKKVTLAAILGWSLVLVFCVVQGAEATVLDFDTVTADYFSSTMIPNGYGGLNWDNFGVVPRTLSPGSGYDHGTVSGDFAAFNAYGNPATVTVTGDDFDFIGAYLTGAWYNDLHIIVEGYRGSTLIYDTTVIVDSTAPPTFFTFNYLDIDSLGFYSYGGTYAGHGGGVGYSFAMDDFTFNGAGPPVPEPASLVLLGMGLSGMAYRRFRKA